MKMFYYDYLTEDQRSPATFTNPVLSVNEVLTTKKKLRDRKKKLFRLADADTPAELIEIYSGIDERLTKGLPVDTFDTESTKQLLSMYAGTNSDQYGASGVRMKGNRQRLLAKPGPQTVVTLFRPALEFLARAKKLSRVIEVEDMLSFLQDYFVTFFIPLSSSDLLNELGGSNGLKVMIKEIVGVEEAEEEVNPTATVTGNENAF